MSQAQREKKRKEIKMNVETIINELDQEFPRKLAMDWDNPGLQVGSRKKEVKKVMVALDATNEVIEECIAWHADLLLTHHPLLLSGIRQINDESMHGRKVLMLAEHGIAHYAMHTDYDVAKMAELAGTRLHLKNRVPLEQTGIADGIPYGIGCIGEFEAEMTAQDCCALVKEVFALPHVRLFGAKDAKIKKTAVCPGSGKSMIAEALAGGAQIYITGDIGHHDGLDAMDQGLAIIDAGHYGIEQIFIPHMEAWMKNHFGELEVKRAKQAEPFEVV